MHRQGDTSADALQQQFALAFKGEVARELFLELAEVLPSTEERSQLLRAAAAAGWAPQPAVQDMDMSLTAAVITSQLNSTAEPGQAAGPLAAEEDARTGDSEWQPLDRSRIAEAASAMSESPVSHVQVIAFPPYQLCMLWDSFALVGFPVLPLLHLCMVDMACAPVQHPQLNTA